MARLPLVSSEQVIKALRRAGFIDAPKRGKGSHRALYKVTGRKRLVIVPKRRELPRGTLAAILEQAGLTLEEFLKWLR
jgi:predicted RNA binding protein YcfA (HicA-like mRNA interferase family)